MNTVTRERLEELRSLVVNTMPSALGVRVADRGEDLGDKSLKMGSDVARLFFWVLALSSNKSPCVVVPARPVFFAQLDYERGGEPSFLNPTDFIEHVARLQLQIAETRQAVPVFNSRQYMADDGISLDAIVLEYNPLAHAVLCKLGVIQATADSQRPTGSGEEQGGKNER